MYSIQNIIYINSCAHGLGDKGIRERNLVEYTIESRDFTGMDMNAWIDALCFPDKPYAARGIHPLGVGYDRYIMYDEITEEGRKYLRRQVGLDVFNFMSPMMAYHSKFFDPYLELGWKSKGWVAGNVCLNSTFFMKAGIRWQICRR